MNRDPSSLMFGVDNFSAKTANRDMYSASEWNATGKLADWTCRYQKIKVLFRHAVQR